MFTYNLKRSFLILTNFAAFNLAVPKEVIAEHAITFVHVCGLNAQTPSCKQIDENFLISKVQAYLEYKNNSRCQRPNNPSCGALIKSATSYHVIYDTTSEQVKKKKLHVELTDRGHVTEYNVSSVSPTYQEKNALQPMLVYKNELATVGKRFSFSVNDSGKMMNLLGETLSDVASLYGRSSSTHTDGQSIGNCRTMLDYVNNTRINSSLPSCQNQLNTFLDNAMDAAQNDLQHFSNSVNLSINLVGIPLSATYFDQVLNTAFRFEDDSKLVLKITMQGQGVGIEIKTNKNASRTSENSTLAQLEQALSDPRQRSRDYSAGEGFALFGQVSLQCSTQLRTTGYNQKVRIEVVEHDAQGRPTKLRITLLSQQQNIEKTVTC